MAEYDSVIPAGGSGTLTAKMKTSSVQNGMVSKSISVETDSPDLRTARLRFTVDIEAPIIAKPRLRFVLSVIEGNTGNVGLALHRADGEALEILKTEIDVGGLRVTAEPIAKADKRDRIELLPGDVWLELAVDPAAKPVSNRGSIRLTTNHPQAPELEVPYVLRVRPLIESRPPQVNLWLSGGTAEGRSTIVSLNQNGKKAFRITDAEVSHPELFWAKFSSTQAAPRQTVRVGLVEGVEMGSITGSITGSRMRKIGP